jgi:hypothetical protein
LVPEADYIVVDNDEHRSVNDTILATSLGSLESKHIPQNLENAQSDIFDSLARKVGYHYSRIGAHQGLTQVEDVDRVRLIASNGSLRPMRVVISKDGRLWADNTHTGLALLLRCGAAAELADIPCYFVDLCGIVPRVIHRPSTLIEPYLSVCVSKAKWLQWRIDLGWRPLTLSFTLGELFALGEYGP